MPIVTFSQTNKITDIQCREADTATRVLFDLSQTIKPRVFTLANPDRLVIDFADTRLGVALKDVHFNNPDIKSIRSGHPTPDTLRLVIDMAVAPHYKIVSGADDTRFAIEIPSPTAAKNESAVPPIITIVVDPGHGGKDPGTIGANGTREKDVVLGIAKKLAALINAQPNMRAVLTRKGDYFVSLRNRIKRAHKGRADLFVAIHADSYFNDRSSGVSIYALSQSGATSEAARWLAKRDNYSELGSVDLRDLEDQSHVLRSVLLDLSQTATITESLRLGNKMLGSLGDVTKLHYSRVEQAPFVVLKSPDIPSVLVETGFLSNENEELRLRDPEYQEQLAEALFDGITLYLKKYPILSS